MDLPHNPLAELQKKGFAMQYSSDPAALSIFLPAQHVYTGSTKIQLGQRFPYFSDKYQSVLKMYGRLPKRQRGSADRQWSPASGPFIMALETAAWEQLKQAACPGPAGKLDGFPQLPLEPLCADFPWGIHKTWGGLVHGQSTSQPVTKKCPEPLI